MINKKILGLLGLATRAGKVSFGTQSVIEKIRKKKVKLVIIAEDASERTKKNFEELCASIEVDRKIFGNIKELSSAIGQTNKAIIGIEDENFAREIEKIFYGGDAIG